MNGPQGVRSPAAVVVDAWTGLSWRGGFSMTLWRWSEATVRTKQTVITMAVCFTALVLAGAGVTTYHAFNARQQLMVNLQRAAAVIGDGSASAVQSRDPEAAAAALAALKIDTQIEAARIDLLDGTSLATYGVGAAAIPSTAPGGVFDAGDAFVVSRRIALDSQTIGVVHIRASLDRTSAQVRRASYIVLGVVVLAGLAAYLLAFVLQEKASGPLLHLVRTSGQVSASRDYGLRAAKIHNDELGRLVDEFNGMLGLIERSDADLREARDQLEARVADRTRALELDIVERRRVENDLMVARAAAEEASRAKSAFLASMSHELRTPLNAIIGHSELLMEEAQGVGALESFSVDISKIAAASRHLMALINDMLDLSKIEAGRMELEVTEFDGAELLRAVVATAEPLAAMRLNTLGVATLAGLGSFRTDRFRLQQILLNLLSNACKFTTNGAVTVSASRELIGGRAWASIHVADSGIGMTPDQRAGLFREFAQADASTTRRYGGTGLGLAICERLCRLLGGEILVESTVGHGSVFTVRIPIDREVALSTTGQGGSTGHRQTAESYVPTIAVIDDDAGARDIAVRALRRTGYRTVEALGADEGLQLIAREQPAAIVLDVILPGRNGWSLLEELKATPGLASIPVVIVSVHDSRQQSLSLGAIEHLTKPLRVDRLLAALESCVPGAGGAAAPVSPTEPAEMGRS